MQKILRSALSKKQKKEIIAYIAESVLKQGKPIYIFDILSRYKKVYVANSGSLENVQCYKSQNLSKMLKNEFPTSVLTIHADATKKMVAFKAGSMSTEVAYEKAKLSL